MTAIVHAPTHLIDPNTPDDKMLVVAITSDGTEFSALVLHPATDRLISVAMSGCQAIFEGEPEEDLWGPPPHPDGGV